MSFQPKHKILRPVPQETPSSQLTSPLSQFSTLRVNPITGDYLPSNATSKAETVKKVGFKFDETKRSSLPPVALKPSATLDAYPEYDFKKKFQLLQKLHGNPSKKGYFTPLKGRGTQPTSALRQKSVDQRAAILDYDSRNVANDFTFSGKGTTEDLKMPAKTPPFKTGGEVSRHSNGGDSEDEDFDKVLEQNSLLKQKLADLEKFLPHASSNRRQKEASVTIRNNQNSSRKIKFQLKEDHENYTTEQSVRDLGEFKIAKDSSAQHILTSATQSPTAKPKRKSKRASLSIASPGFPGKKKPHLEPGSATRIRKNKLLERTLEAMTRGSEENKRSQRSAISFSNSDGGMNTSQERLPKISTISKLHLEDMKPLNVRQRMEQYMASRVRKFKIREKKQQMSTLDIKRAKEQLRQLKMREKMRERLGIESHYDRLNQIIINSKATLGNGTDGSPQKVEGGYAMDLVAEEQDLIKGGDTSSSYRSLNKNVNRGTVGRFISQMIKDEGKKTDLDDLDAVNEEAQRTSPASMIREGRSEPQKPFLAAKRSKDTSRASTFINIQDDSLPIDKDQIFQEHLSKKVSQMKASSNAVPSAAPQMDPVPPKSVGPSKSKKRLKDLLQTDSKGQEGGVSVQIENPDVFPDAQLKELFQTQTTFSRIHPEFKTGLTPTMPPGDSEPNSALKEQLKEANVNRKNKSSLMKRKDFEKINQRQRKYKEMMELAKNKGSVFQSELLSRTSKKSSKRFSEFPFQRKAESNQMKAYLDLKKKHKGTKKPLKKAHIRKEGGPSFNGLELDEEQEAAIQEKFSEGDESAYGDDLERKTQTLTYFQKLKDSTKKVTQEESHFAMMKFLDFLTTENFSQNIFQVQKELQDKVLRKGFADYKKLPDPNISQFAKHVQERQHFINICKNANSPRAQEKLVNDPFFIFYKVCSENNVPVLSLLQKTSGQALNLRGYLLNDVLCKAFKEAFRRLPNFINSILLDNNGLRDKGVGMILEGCNSLKNIKKIACRNNQMHYESFCQLKRILQERTSPSNHLQELRLTNVRMSPNLTAELLEIILEESRLRKLTLSKTNMSGESVENLQSLIEKSPTLTDLDISWNELLPNSMYLLAETLSENRKLQFVNLSWNNFKPIDSLIEFQDRVYQEKDSSLQPLRDKEYQNDLEAREEEDYIIENLCSFIKYNPNLIHFDLCHTGLSKHMMLELGPALRRAKSLVCLHLSGNPGIDQELKDALHERAHCVPNLEIQHIDVISRDNFNRVQDGFGVQNQLQEGLKLRDFVEEKTRNENGRLVQSDENSKQKLIFDRILGHKYDIPGSGQWRQLTRTQEKCWICEDRIYTLIFWNRKIGFKCEDNLDSIVEEMMISKLEDLQEKMQKQIEEDSSYPKDHPLAYNLKLGEEKSSPDAPVIYGQFTNWHPTKMMNLKDYCDIIDQNQPDFIGHLIADDKCRTSVNVKAELNAQELKDFDILRQEHKKTYAHSWQQIIERDLPYEKTNLVNLDLLTMEDYEIQGVGNIEESEERMPAEEIYVLPVFARPGKHYYVVRADPHKEETPQGSILDKNPEEGISMDFTFDSALETEWFTHSCIVPFRTEDIPPREKQYETRTIERVFQKNNSVFRDWKEDTEQRLSQSFEHDFSNWKVPKFVKEPEQLEKVQQLMREHLVELKTIHIYFASKSNFPYIQLNEFSAFVNRFQIIDKALNQSVVDMNFIASHSNMGKLEGTQENMILRFQFLEAIVRLANAKYREAGKVKTHSEALQMFIENDIKPFSDEITHEWHNFRTDNLWNLEVNEMFKVNLPSIKAVMESYFQPRQKFLTQQDAIGLFYKDTQDLLLEGDARFIYGMSKMPLPNETKEIKKHKAITSLTELIEMIGRTADFKYRDDNTLTMVEKIGKVLQKILPLAGGVVKYPTEGEDLDESMSDQDY